MSSVKQEETTRFVEKRDGAKVLFDVSKIGVAIRKAFVSQNIHNDSAVIHLAHEVEHLVNVKFAQGETISVEHIQDLVETVLIMNRYPEVAKAYILYRADRQRKRQEENVKEVREHKVTLTLTDGSTKPFFPEDLEQELTDIAHGLSRIDVTSIVQEVTKGVYNKMKIKELRLLTINATKARIESHYEYSSLCARLLASELYKDVLGVAANDASLQEKYEDGFQAYLEKGMEIEMLSDKLKAYDIAKMAKALVAKRDENFHFLGMQTVYDRYLLRERTKGKRVYELPQYMWMRVAMGLALEEANKEERAIEFYNALSNFDVLSSTPTLFNSGTTRSQMSSCFLNTVEDSLTGIFKIYADNAQLCKWAGAVGTDWTPVRSKGAMIKGTNGPSQGTIPFIKIFNDVALAVNQGGKRKGALAAYIEPWHVDIEEYLELRKNTGDERRRAHDIHTALWIPDLFMQRVQEDGKWTLFSPDTVPELHDTYGKKFKELYEKYEEQDIPGAKIIKAKDLWKKSLTMLYETGHPWITFKDPSNIRSPQDHAGVVHASNLCTEITLNTSKEETAVCNLASVNIAKLVGKDGLNEKEVERVVTTAVRMLNAVIDVNFYTIPETENSNLKHRPVGLGLMGYQDALYIQNIEFESEENLEFADASMEMISYYAILASAKIAQETEPYPSFKGSKWDRGLMPIDTVDMLEQERGERIDVSRKTRLDWDKVRKTVKEHGMRNSNVMAIAPTATISNIAGVIPCVEPIYRNLYMKENMSGSFLVINRYLVDELEALGLWDERMLTQLKINNGSVLDIDAIPVEVRRKFKEAFEVEPKWVLRAASLRAKWIDQSASTNIFLKTQSGRILSDVYMKAWKYGLKTTYYLRTLASSQVTKMVDTSVLEKEEKKISPAPVKTPAPAPVVPKAEPKVTVCNLSDGFCEACQ